MDPDAQLILLVMGLHLIGLLGAGLLFALFLRNAENPPIWPSRDEGEDGGGGGNDRPQPQPSRGPRPGGLPLPDAQPAALRLRGPGRLADAHPRPERRPSREPERPRVPTRN
jgi:hypothetical protein